MAELISRSEFARRAHVTPAAVTKWCKGRLAPALDGKLVDAHHPEAEALIALGVRRRRPPKPAPPKRPSSAEVDALADLVIRVIQRVAARLRTGTPGETP